MILLGSSILLGLTILALSVHWIGTVIFLKWIQHSRPQKKLLPVPPPGVTVLKPCYRIEDGEALNYEKFFNQDYAGPLQILFVASRPTDPAAELVRSFLKRYPTVDAELVISQTRRAYWAKIDAVYDGMKLAKYDHLIISDSDAYVRKDYVSQMVSALAEPKVSLVSSPQWDHRPNTIASAFKVLGNNCDSAVFILLGDFLAKRKSLSLGHSIGFRLSEFRSLPENPWQTMNSFLAEDLAYGYLFSRAGKRVALKNIYCPVNFSNKTFKQVHEQKERWLLNQKAAVGSRYLYLFGVFLYPEVPALFYCLATQFGGLGCSLLAVACLTRILLSALVEKYYLGEPCPMTLRYFWMVPLWDLSQIYFFILGFLKNKIRYGRREFKVFNRYFLREIDLGTHKAP